MPSIMRRRRGLISTEGKLCLFVTIDDTSMGAVAKLDAKPIV